MAAHVDGVGADQWNLPTPCTEWDVRALVNHVVGEERWTRPLLEGMTIAEVGDRFDGDLLGDDPPGAGRQAAADSTAAVDELLAGIDKVHLSYGDEDPGEYVRQLCADHLIHGLGPRRGDRPGPHARCGIGRRGGGVVRRT